jgi:hypothetical protein
LCPVYSYQRHKVHGDHPGLRHHHEHVRSVHLGRELLGSSPHLRNQREVPGMRW